MLKKALITGAIILSFLVATTNIVIATNIGTLTDEVGDVLDENTGENTTNKKNIDIKSLVVSRDYREVTFVLTVAGVIENKGDTLIWRLSEDPELLEEYIESMTEEEAYEFFLSLLQDLVIYNFELVTSENYYSIIYGNEEVIIIDETNSYEGTYSVNGDTLTISFRLPSSKEYVDSISVVTYDVNNENIESPESYFDEVYGELEDEIPTDGDNGGEDDNNGSPGFELITILIAIVIGIILLRKKRT